MYNHSSYPCSSGSKEYNDVDELCVGRNITRHVRYSLPFSRNSGHVRSLRRLLIVLDFACSPVHLRNPYIVEPERDITTKFKAGKSCSSGRVSYFISVTNDSRKCYR